MLMPASFRPACASVLNWRYCWLLGRIWLLDEPGANLDQAGRALILREARQAAAEQRLVLWATNDSREEGAADACIHLSGD